MPDAPEVARRIYAKQAIAFTVEERRPLRRRRRVVFGDVGGWLLWQNATGAGAVVELPSGAAPLIASWAAVEELRIASEGLRKVVQSVWDLVS
jgi:hypothetical protein